MIGEIAVTMVGNLTGDPETRSTGSGITVTNFSVASTPRKFDRDSNDFKDGETIFLKVTAWRKLGENVQESLKKGSRVIVVGRLTQKRYENKEGQQVVTMELEAEDVAASLAFATAELTKAPSLLAVTVVK